MKKLKEIPAQPGVYFFKNKKGQDIYIGKSVNLRERAKAYFQNKSLGPYTQKMVNQIADIDWQTCRSEFEALLLEAKLINQHQPKYNVRLKDDKRFLMIGISDESYPQIYTTRKKEKKGWFFGPFPSAMEVRRVLKTIRRIFPYCTCSPRTRDQKKACLYYHLDLCPGCCLGYSQQEYRKTIKKIIRILNGDIQGLVKQLKREMKQASKDLNFEKAAQIKKQIEAINWAVLNWQSFDEETLTLSLPEDKKEAIFKEIKTIFPQLKTLKRIEGYDISNLYGQQATGSLVVFEDFLPNKNEYRRFRLRVSGKPDDVAMMKEILSRRLRHPEWPKPGLIVVDGGKAQVAAVFSVLKEKIPLLGLAKKEETIIKPKIKRGEILGWQEIKLPQDSEFLRLLQHLRNESHRFAKKYHLLLRRKRLKRRGSD